MTYQLADLADAALGPPWWSMDGYSKIFKLAHASGATVAESLAEAQARFPSVPIVFCETRSLAQEWVYRWLGACRREHELRVATARVEDTFAPGHPLPDPGSAPARRRPPSDDATIRAWALGQGVEVSARGRVSASVRRAWQLRATAED